MAKNVVIKKRVQAFNIDALNRAVIATEDLENGCVFALNGYSVNEGEGEVWTAEAPANDTVKGLWMATTPEVVIVRDEMGNEYKGINPDPRAFVNYAGKVIDATKLMVGDIIEMTGANISGIDGADYLVPVAGEFKLAASTEAKDGLCLRKIGVGELHIGTAGIYGAPVATYKFEVVNN